MSRYNYTVLNKKYKLPLLPGFDKYLASTRRSFDGWQAKYKFKNGYGASIIQHMGSFGAEDGDWELGILYKDVICYDTPIAADVIGHLKIEDLAALLADIKALPKRKEIGKEGS